MKRLFSIFIFCTFVLTLTAQDKPVGGQQMQQTQDRLIDLSTNNISLVYKVTYIQENGRRVCSTPSVFFIDTGRAWRETTLQQGRFPP